MHADETESIEVFFYGLFMDEAALRGMGLTPSAMRRAVLRGFEMRIGQRATLVRRAEGTVHGMLASLPPDQLDRLYSEPNVRDYRPEPVSVEIGRSHLAALCFNLRSPPPVSEHSAEYAARLRALAEKVGLPAEYIETIR